MKVNGIYRLLTVPNHLQGLYPHLAQSRSERVVPLWLADSCDICCKSASRQTGSTACATMSDKHVQSFKYLNEKTRRNLSSFRQSWFRSAFNKVRNVNTALDHRDTEIERLANNYNSIGESPTAPHTSASCRPSLCSSLAQLVRPFICAWERRSIAIAV